MPRILRIQLCQLAQNFLGALVADVGSHDLDLDDLVAAHAFLHRRGNTFLAQAKLLSTLRARRNLQQRASIDGGHFDLATQSRFAERHRHSEVDVVAVALEQRMLAHSHHDVKIAGGGSHGSGISATSEADALAIAGTSLDAHLQRLVAFHASLTVAHVADSAILAAAPAMRARN